MAERGMAERMPRLICIIGTDGSGKTTLAESVAEGLRARGIGAERVWLGSESYLMAPLRRLLRRLWARRSDGGGDYGAEIASKQGLVARHGWAVPLYVTVLWLDYRLQVAAKRWRHRRSGTIVADRYLFDVAVNLGLVLGWTPDQVVTFVQRRLAGMALPELRVFLRVEPEVSLARKTDIPDAGYLRLRFRHYEAIARAFGFAVRDGTLPVAVNRDWLIAEAEREGRRRSVLYVHANNGDVGGADRVLVSMARHMRDFGRPEGGARVAVCLRLGTAVAAEHAARGVPVILHPFLRPQTSRGPAGVARAVFLVPGTLWFFWRLFGREGPDIVHVNDLYDLLPVLAARLRGIPAVWHVRMIRTEPRLRRFFAAVLTRLAPVSVSVSQAVRDHYFPQGAAKGHRALVVHDLGNGDLVAAGGGGEGAAARPAGLPVAGGGRRLVVMVGRIEPWKGQDLFVAAVERLPRAVRAGHDFAIAGGPVAGKEAYADAVRQMALRAGITFLGQRDDVPAILRAADVSVHASVMPDPFPGVVIESLLAGAGTIAAAEGGAVEMIRPGQDGLLVPPRDAGALSAAICGMLTGGVAPRARYGAAGRARALWLVDAGRIDAQLAEIYEGIAGRPCRQRVAA